MPQFARDGFTVLGEKQAEILEELSPDLKESMFDLKEFSKLPKWKKKMILEAKIYDVAGRICFTRPRSNDNTYSYRRRPPQQP